jgi:hypothetical protein
VCPDGFSEVGGLCQKTLAYTFHTETVTTPYTYHQDAVQTGTVEHFSADCSGGGVYYPNNNPPGCYRWDWVGYYVTVKDAPPAGYTDNGTAYAKDVQVKDALPAGYTDDGTQWVKTAAKEARVVAI